MKSVQKHLVVVAGGKGLRMGGELPKQFMEIGGKPILMHTLEAFVAFDADINIVLVLPKTHEVYWNELCDKNSFALKHTTVEGGETRFHSVLNGLKVIHSDGLVAIHDGVRPFANIEMLDRVFSKAFEAGNALPVVPIKDSLREVEGEINKAVERSRFFAVQTPQVFEINSLKKAYKLGYQSFFTDDASVYEANGNQINLVMGDYENIKITTLEDLWFAQEIIKKRLK